MLKGMLLGGRVENYTNIKKEVDTILFWMELQEMMILSVFGFLTKSFGSKPEWNYVYSANNQPEAVDGFYIPAIIYLKDKLQE
jgi:hypothetical protein